MAIDTPVVRRSEIVEARYLGGWKHTLSIPFGLLSVMQDVAIVGSSRADRTAVLLRLADPLAQRAHGLDPSDFLSCYLNLGGVKCASEQEVFGLMLSGMIHAASRRPALTHLQTPPSPCQSTFTELLSYVEHAEMIGPNLVWMLDEFDSASRNPKLTPNFFSALRALGSRPRAALVTATRHGLYGMGEARRPAGSSLAGLFVTIHLDRLRVHAS